ncbi:MAG: hypothetical protein ABFD18_15410 [Syntrophomonas sp.]
MLINELKLQPGNIAHIDVVRLQIEFGVSYRAMVRRLSDLGKLGPHEDDHLYKYFEETGEGLKPLFRRAQAPSYNMLEAWERVWVPNRYLRCLEANYASGLVTYPVLEKILDIVDVTPEEWDLFPPSKPGADEDIDIDALIKEFSDET